MKLRIQYHYLGDTNEYVAKCADLEDIKYFLENLEKEIIYDELSIIEQ